MVLFATSILITNYKENIFKKVIHSKILASLGLISYSLYLWHWPLISLLRYYSINEPDFINKLLVIIISLKLDVTNLLHFSHSKKIEPVCSTSP